MNMQKLMQEAKKMQVKLEKCQKELSETTFTGTSSIVEVKVTGNYKVVEVKIKMNDDISLDDKDMLEDMLMLAMNDALDQIKDSQKSMMGNYGSNMFGMM